MKKFGQMMTHKAVHLLSLFLMVYIGVEVTIGGIIHFLHRCFLNKKSLIVVNQGGPHRS